MKKSLFTLSVFALTSILTSCLSDSNSDNSDNSGRSLVDFELKVKGSNSKLSKSSKQPMDYSFTDKQGTVFTLTEARVNVRNIQFELPEAVDTVNQEICETSGDDSIEPCEIEENEIVIQGPFVVNLITGEASPDINSISVPAGVYKRIDVRMDDSNPEDGLVAEGDDLENATLVLKGTFTYDGVENRGFSFISKLNEDVRFENENGIVIESQNLSITASLELNTWLEGVDITGCLDDGDMALDADGNLSVTDESKEGKCAEAEGIIKDNMKNATDLD